MSSLKRNEFAAKRTLAGILIFLIVFDSIEIINGNENTVFIYNHIESCKSSEYYDINYFLCRKCDPQSNLVPSDNGKFLFIMLK